MINHVYLDLGHGYEDAKFYPGATIGHLFETDLIDTYGRSIMDEFTIDGLFHTVLNTRKSPGMNDQERQAIVVHNRALMLSLHIGSSVKPSPFNEGKIYIADESSRDLAELIKQHMIKWGNATSSSYRQVRIMTSAQPVLKGISPYGILLEPFLINSQDATKFAMRLPSLGTALGRAIVSYVRTQNPAAGTMNWTMNFANKGERL